MTYDSETYEQMAAAIAFIAQHHLEQPNIEAIANHVHAKTRSLMALTHEVGLSSPGRLHDLFVSLEAMSPGEYKAGGAGLRIFCGIHQGRVGWLSVGRGEEAGDRQAGRLASWVN